MLFRLIIFVCLALSAMSTAVAQREEGKRVTWKPSYSGSCQDCNLVGLQMTQWDVSRVRYDRSDFSYASLYAAQANETHFTSITATRTEFSRAQLNNAQFSGAVMQRVRMIGVDATGANFADATLDYGDLREGKFIGTNFGGTSVAHGLCRGADFSASNGTGANFDFTMLNGAMFNGALLRGASFVEADVSGASFRDARLHGANMARIINSGLADFSGACRSETTLLPPGLALPLCEDSGQEPRLIEAP